MSNERFTRRDFLKASSGFFASSLIHQFQKNIGHNPLAKRPNLVFILTDQLRSVSVGAYGNPDISTPNIDQLATEGALFERAVSTTPQCSPYRACLITGRYPTKTGMYHNEMIKLSRREKCISEVYSRYAFESLYIGKWHLNGEKTEDVNEDPGWVAPKDRQGFENWLAYNTAHLYYGSHYYKNRDQTIRTIPDGVYEPDWQTDKAIDFITQNSANNFIVFLSIGTPHHPTTGGNSLPPGGDYVFPYDPESITLRPNMDYPDEAYIRQELADYFGMISNIDWNMGRVMSTLSDLGIEQDTIVVFTSDHGALHGSHYSTYGTLRKKTVIEREGLEVPFIIRYPRRIIPQVVTDVYSSVDIMPTLLGLSKMNVPYEVMGRDFSPLLINGGLPIDPPYGTPPSSESALVGVFDLRWVGCRTPQFTLEVQRSSLSPNKLFDNTNDPYQMNNLVDDPGYQDVVDNLLAETLAWLEYIGYF